ncbi:MAG: hypothetical protein ABR950_05155 [Candidatus Dormibacteria bacterium]
MLRQIARLARPVPFAGPAALAIAVYSDALNHPIRAEQAGYEGVACVDDAARALELYCDLWRSTGAPWVRRWCEGLLDFVLAMQDADGRWLNFIRDWEGAPNHEARTSVAGGDFWQARALLAVARAGQVFDDDTRILDSLRRGLPHVVEATDVPADVRALHIRTALTLLEDGDDRGLLEEVAVWSEEVAACRDGDRLMNSPDEHGAPHLWGHIQEGVLADAGVRLGRHDLVVTACRSADLVFRTVVMSGFDLDRTQPYDVASAVYVLTRIADVTGTPTYAALAGMARSWFDRRNTAGQPVYDRPIGRVSDGVDHGRVSDNSGAEANIVAAQALFAETTRLAKRLSAREALPAPAA